MSVLITGGRSAIGKLLAKRFHKEGHSVIHVAMNLEKVSKKATYHYDKEHGVKQNEFKSYQFENNVEKLEWVFKANRFDVVIHIEDRWESSEEVRFNQLVGHIDLANLYGVKQFIFVPTIYDVTHSSYDLLKAQLLINQKTLSLATLVVENLYGPNLKAEELNEGMVQYIDATLKHRYSVLKQEDYYYIDDVIDAIYKLVSQKHLGVFELGQTTISGWQPKYSLEVGLKRTVSWYKKNKTFWEIDETVEKQSLWKRLEVLLPYGENILIFLITFLLAYQTRDNTVRYNVFPLDFNLIYIFLMSIIYGMSQGIIAIVLACFSYVYVYLNISPNLASIVYSQTHIIQLLVYVLVGVVTAYIVDNKRRQIENLKGDLNIAHDQKNFIEEVCQQVTAVKEALEEQILNTDNSLGKIYELSKELNSLLIEDVYYGAIHTLEKLLKAQAIAIYKCNHTRTFLRLMTHSKQLSNEVTGSLRVDDYEEIKKVIKDKQIFINYQLDKSLPMMMAPIVYRDEVIAVVFIDAVPFESLTLYYENFFRVAIGLIENAITQALMYEEAIKHKRYIGDSGVVHMRYFNELIKNKQRAKLQFNIPYTILVVAEGGIAQAEAIKHCIRETDYIGSNEVGEIYIMLSNSDISSSQLIVERLNKKGIEATIYKGVSA